MQRVRQRRDWAEGREVVPVEDDVGHGSRAGNHLTPFPSVVCWCTPAEMLALWSLNGRANFSYEKGPGTSTRGPRGGGCWKVRKSLKKQLIAVTKSNMRK